MPKKISLIGQTFGRLKVIADAPRKNKHTYCFCECQCGETKTVRNDGLTRGTTQSCGCLQKDCAAGAKFKHGFFAESNPHLGSYRAWHAMMRRCYEPSADVFQHYGGRGISVCERWKLFKNFLEDMGDRPPNMTLERIEVEGNYEPSNCKWDTKKNQARNRRNSIKIIFQGEESTLSEFCERLGINYHTAYGRLSRGMVVESILSRDHFNSASHRQ